MKPIHGAGEFGTDLEKPIVPSDVREFMRENDVAAVLRPLSGARRKHDDRAKDSPSERHAERTAALQEPNRAFDFMETGKFQDGAHPTLVEQGLRVRRHPSEARKTREEPQEDEGEAEYPGEESSEGKFAEHGRGRNCIHDDGRNCVRTGAV